MRVRVLVAAVAATAVFAGSAQAAPRFTALGDSYAAGPLIPLPLPPFGCLKSSNNYGRIAQRTLRFAEYRDATCSGAETEDMTAPQNVSPRPEPAAVQRAVHGDAARDGHDRRQRHRLLRASPRTACRCCPFGSPCRDQYVRNGDEISRRIAETAPKVDAVLDGIRARYAGDHADPGRQLLGDLPAQRQRLLAEDARHAAATSRGCAPSRRSSTRMLAHQAARQRRRLVDVYAASARPRRVHRRPARAGSSPTCPANAAAPLHPNLRGMQAMAAMVVSRSS